MIPYIVMFILTFICTLLAQKSYKNNKMKRFKIYSFLAIMLPSILAGLRMSGVGTDTQVYIDNSFNAAVKTSLSSLPNLITNSSIEFGYILINFIVSRFTDNVNFVYFVFELIMMFFVYKACFKLNKNQEFSFSYLCFLLLFYNRTLNLCRQYLALSVILYSYSFIKEKKYIEFIIFQIVACSFHLTSLINVLILFIYKFINSKKKLKIFNKILITSIILLILLVYQHVSPILFSMLGDFGDKYSVYSTRTNNGISVAEFGFNFMFVLLGLLINSKDDDYINFRYLSLIGVLLYLMGTVVWNAQRLSFYFIGFLPFVITRIPYYFKTNKQRNFVTVLIILLLFAYNYYGYGIVGWDSTYPYRWILGA